MTERTVSAEERPFDAPALLPIGEHECVTCTRCALSFAAAHPACPRCAQAWRGEQDLARLSVWVSGDVARARELAKQIVGDERDSTRVHPEAQRAHRFAAEIVALLEPPKDTE